MILNIALGLILAYVLWHVLMFFLAIGLVFMTELAKAYPRVTHAVVTSVIFGLSAAFVGGCAFLGTLGQW